MIRAFSLKYDQNHIGKCVLHFQFSKDLPFTIEDTDLLNVLPARLLGLTYDNYLRFARDRLGAELIGKRKKYITVLFENNSLTQKFVETLNTRLKLVLYNLEHPYYFKEQDGKLIKVPFNTNEDHE